MCPADFDGKGRYLREQTEESVAAAVALEKQEPLETKSPLAVQVGGNHYKNMKIQPIQFIQANGLGFEVGNAIKYLCRYQHKDGAQDLRKALHYIEMLLAHEYPEQ
jgi:hypothetical protein